MPIEQPGGSNEGTEPSGKILPQSSTERITPAVSGTPPSIGRIPTFHAQPEIIRITPTPPPVLERITSVSDTSPVSGRIPPAPAEKGIPAIPEGTPPATPEKIPVFPKEETPAPYPPPSREALSIVTAQTGDNDENQHSKEKGNEKPPAPPEGESLVSSSAGRTDDAPKEQVVFTPPEPTNSKEPPEQKDAVEQREILSDQQIGDHLAGYANHEGKAGIVAAMESEGEYTVRSMHALAHPSGESLWGYHAPSAWSENSLAPLGFTQVIVDPNTGITVHKITEEGEQGVPLAGHLLTFSEQHSEISLLPLLGSTQVNTEPRSPLTRFQIYSELVGRDDLPIRQQDLIASLKNRYPDGHFDQSKISKHLEKISEAGLITYESIKADTSFIFYRAPDVLSSGSIPPYDTYAQLTERVHDILSQSETPVSNEDVYTVLESDYPHYKKGPLKELIGRTLAHLARTGHAKKEGFTHGRQSSITLNTAQQATLTEFVALVERFRSQDPEFLAEGRRKAQAIVADTLRFRALMGKAYQASSHANQLTSQEMIGKIQTILRDYPGSTNREIHAHLQTTFERRINIQTVRNLTSSLVQSAQIRSYKEEGKSSLRFSLAEETTIFESEINEEQ